MIFKLKILTPTTGFSRMAYTASLVKLVMYYMQNRIWLEEPTQELDYKTVEGSGVSANREELVAEALQTDCTHILFIDEDMGFAPQTLHILASRRQRIVGCNYPMRVKGKGFTALRPDCKGRITTGPASAGLEPAFYTGFGFCLIERSVFDQIKRPWFLIGYDTNAHVYTTEDAAFGRLLQEAGIPWYVDHDASKCITHIGNYGFTWNEVQNGDTP